ncbi:mechanosensitive ion channel domain-containing protein [Kitasatospora sp. NPDC088351]|uniref:mechanosensitive ion channel family protein n=1 Tax=unclassified Kitasatospora TaxID=2633591 RepID=UPI00343D5846
MEGWSLVRLLAVASAAAIAAYVLNLASEAVARLLAARGHTGRVPALLRGCRPPLLAATACGLILAGEPWVRAAPAVHGAVRHLLVLAAIASCAWLTARLVRLLVDGALHLAVRRRDPAWAGRARTQAGLLGRICQAAVAVVALGAMLMTFPAVRGLGTSLLASAGLVGVVAGIAAQSTLANLFAGVQMAFGDLVRIGDVVVVAGEWGTVEEITLTSVVVATWDQRRLVMPMSYFAGRPFENWSRRTSRITGTALIHLDHSAPVAALRMVFDDFLAKNALWDGEGRALQVVDTTPTTIVVRALMTAANADDAFELRCQVREHLVAHVHEHHPHALPRVPVAPAAGRPGEPCPTAADQCEGPRPGM